MKRWLAILLLIGILTGCSHSHSRMDSALNLRNSLISGKGCSFDAVITADYGDRLYTFEMKNTVGNNGNLTFEVASPDSIAGITGSIEEENGALTFDNEVLAFHLMTDGQITPVSAPWIFIKSLRSGYIRACEDTQSGMRVQIDDSYADDALKLDIWTDSNDVPVRAEILYRGQRIITLDVENFVIL